MRHFVDTPVGSEAVDLVTGARQALYGDPLESLDRISNLWSDLLGVTITPRQVAHMMILLKVSRDQTVPIRDNEVDICGYAHLLQMEREECEDKEEGKPVEEDEETDDPKASPSWWQPVSNPHKSL